ncbi:MAG TPA: hypothetical protein VF805_12560 [Anaeromyxobacteraceae bacterium]
MRLLAALAAAALLACGVKAPPRPPLREEPDAGSTPTPTPTSTSTATPTATATATATPTPTATQPAVPNP